MSRALRLPHGSPGHPLVRALGDSGYRVALAALPAWFAAPFAAEMRETFAHRQQEALTGGGLVRWTYVIARELTGTLQLAARARARGRKALLTLPERSPAAAGTPGDPRRPSPSTGSNFMDTLLQDIRYAARGLRKAPGFTAVAAITLMLGIGVNTTIFTIVNTVLLAPLPVEDPGAIVALYGTKSNAPLTHDSSSYPDYLDLRRQSGTLSGLVAYTNFFANLVQDGSSEIVVGELVSDNYFEVLGVPLTRGRAFTAEELATEGASPVAVISDHMWRTRYNADANILGRTVRLNGTSYTVVGVAEPGFGGLFPAVTAQLWLPVTMVDEVEPLGNINTTASESGDTRLTRRGFRFLWLRGRLADGVDLAQARAELTGIMARLAEEHPVSNELEAISVLAAGDVRFNPDIDGAVAPVGSLILAVVGLVLLVACANIANMLLARASVRDKEVAIRLALGAGRGRLVRQLLTESLLLSLLGGGLGLLLAAWMTRVLGRLDLGIPVDVAADFAISGSVLLFTLLVSVGTGVVFGLVPALRASRPDLVPALKAAGSGADAGRRGLELRDALVVVQVAVSIVLLIGGGLLARSLVNAERTDVGFDVDRVGFMATALDMIGYEQETAKAFVETARLRLQGTPGVQAVGVTTRVPQSVNNNGFGLFIEQTSATDRPHAVDGTYIDEHYFAAFDLAIVAGRGIEAADIAGDRNVVVVTAAMAQRFWPNESAVGKRFRRTFDGPEVEIVGVVEDYKVNTPGEEPTPYLHFPLPSRGTLFANFIVRTDAPVAADMRRLEQVVRDLDAEIVFMQTGPLRDLMDVRLLPIRMGTWFIGGFATLAMALAAVGLYGVIGYSVSRRTREIGIRVALGARAGRVLGLVVRQGMVLVGVGVVIGAALAALAGQVLSSVLYGISPVDPIAFGGAIGLLVLIALLANYIPARRATRIDPMVALRSE
jgi:predicted permease